MFLGPSIDWPTGVALLMSGGYEVPRCEFAMDLPRGTLASVDLLDALGTLGVAEALGVRWVISDFLFDPASMAYETLSLTVVESSARDQGET